MVLKPGLKEGVFGHVVMIKVGRSMHGGKSRCFGERGRGSNLALPLLSHVIFCEGKTVVFQMSGRDFNKLAYPFPVHGDIHSTNVY